MTTRSYADLVRTWPPDASSVADARACLRQCLRHWDLQEIEDAGAVVLSEMTTNAVLHAATEFTVTLCRMPDGLLIRVGDGVAAGPAPSAPAVDGLATGGRGMHLIEALTFGWGVVLDGHGGKTVWALIHHG